MMHCKPTANIEYDLTKTYKSTCCSFQKIPQDFLPFFQTLSLFYRLFPGLENRWANFKTKDCYWQWQTFPQLVRQLSSESTWVDKSVITNKTVFQEEIKKGCRKILANISKRLPFLFDSPLSPSSEEINSKDCARGISPCLRDAVGLPLGEPGGDLLVVLSASLLFSFRWLHAFMGDCELLTLCEPTLRLRRVLKGDILTLSSRFWLLRESNKEFWREYAGCPLSDLWTKGRQDNLHVTLSQFTIYKTRLALQLSIVFYPGLNDAFSRYISVAILVFLRRVHPASFPGSLSYPSRDLAP